METKWMAWYYLIIEKKCRQKKKRREKRVLVWEYRNWLSGIIEKLVHDWRNCVNIQTTMLATMSNNYSAFHSKLNVRVQ